MSNHADPQPFYVGYLPLPHAIKRFVVPWLAGNFVLVIGVALLLAQQHRAPGDGVWDTGQLGPREGILLVDPSPLLWTQDGDYIRVEQGK